VGSVVACCGGAGVISALSGWVRRCGRSRKDAVDQCPLRATLYESGEEEEHVHRRGRHGPGVGLVTTRGIRLIIHIVKYEYLVI